MHTLLSVQDMGMPKVLIALEEPPHRFILKQNHSLGVRMIIMVFVIDKRPHS